MRAPEAPLSGIHLMRRPSAQILSIDLRGNVQDHQFKCF